MAVVIEIVKGESFKNLFIKKHLFQIYLQIIGFFLLFLPKLLNEKISKMLCMSDFLCIIKKLEGIFHFLTKNFRKYKKNQKKTKVNNFSTKHFSKIFILLNKHEKPTPLKQKNTH